MNIWSDKWQWPAARTRRGRDRLRARKPAGTACLLLVMLGLVWVSGMTWADTPGQVSGSVQPRIIGGIESQRGAWPSVVALMFARQGFSVRQRSFCGGTVVHPRWVLTAAHCVFTRAGDVINPASVVIGSDLLDMATDEPVETVVTNIFTHPNYNPPDADSPYDIALLELATNIDVPVVPMFHSDPELLIGQPSTVIGWGSTTSDTASPIFPTRLRQGYPPIISRAQCNEPQAYAGRVLSNQVCAGLREGGLDSCAGDSGGPLMVQIKDEVQQIGIVSYGDGCAEPNKYGVYTSVSAFDDWVAQYVALTPAQRSPHDEPDSAAPGNPPGNQPDEAQEPTNGTIGDTNSPFGLGGSDAAWLVLLGLAAIGRLRRGGRTSSLSGSSTPPV